MHKRKPCFCAVYKFPKDHGKARIIYCPLHEIAPEMQAALEKIHHSIAFVLTSRAVPEKFRKPLTAIAEVASKCLWPALFKENS